MAHIEKIGNFFQIRLNLVHPQPSLFQFGLLSPLSCFSTLVNNYFEAFFNLKVILQFAKNDLKYRDIAPLKQESTFSKMLNRLRSPWLLFLFRLFHGCIFYMVYHSNALYEFNSGVRSDVSMPLYDLLSFFSNCDWNLYSISTKQHLIAIFGPGIS